MYIWVHGTWEHVNGVLLDAEQKVGPVKVFDGYYGESKTVPDISLMKAPHFWDWNTAQKEWRHVDKVKGLCEKKQGNDTVKAMGSAQYGKQMTSSGSK